MARLFMDGWEHGQPAVNIDPGIVDDPTDSIWTVKTNNNRNYLNNGIGVTSDSYNSGDYGMRFQIDGYDVNTQCLYKQLDSTYNVLYSRFYIKPTFTADPGIISFFGLDDTAGYSNSLSMDLRYDSGNGTVYLYVNGSQISSSVSEFISNTWKLIEIMYNNSTSNIIVKIDSNELFNYSGTIDSSINHVSLGKCDIATSGAKYKFIVDDFAINDNSGSVNNSWIGAGVIRLIKPTSDDTNADFTPSTGSDHYALVDDFPDDGDTTYNSSTVSGDIDTFGLEAVPSVVTGQTINAVQAVYRARSETDIASVAPILISGATTDTGSTQSTVLSDYNDTKQKVYDVDPNTSAQWTEANVNSIKGGYKNVT